MLSCELKMHQIHFRPGLRPGTPLRELMMLPQISLVGWTPLDAFGPNLGAKAVSRFSIVDLWSPYPMGTRPNLDKSAG